MIVTGGIHVCQYTTIKRLLRSTVLWIKILINAYPFLFVQIAPDCKVIILPKDELDKANKDKKHYPQNFQVSDLTAYYTPAWTIPWGFLEASTIKFCINAVVQSPSSVCVCVCVCVCVFLCVYPCVGVGGDIWVCFHKKGQ